MNSFQKYFYNLVTEFYQFLIPEGARVAEVGPTKLELHQTLKPQHHTKIGADLKEEEYKNFAKENFDYVVATGLLSTTGDIQKTLAALGSLSHAQTKIVVSVYNNFWESILTIGSKLGIRSKSPLTNWLTDVDLENLMHLEDLIIVSKKSEIIFPLYIPLLSKLLNSYISKLPLFSSLCLVKFYVLRKRCGFSAPLKSSIVIPARNESGNIENAVKRLPPFGGEQEIIFVEGNSTDNTWEEIQRVQKAYPDKKIKILKQPGKGKGDAVRCGFAAATGDILFILDADLTVPPEDLPKFYDAVYKNVGEFINGTRLVYPMEKEAMRFLNLLGNKFFAFTFSWLLGQKFRDTLCGTKVLLKSNYEKIAANRKYFGDFDPFGDFDLLFGAAKQNLQIVEIPIKYKERTYGTTNISRFRHGWLLLQMCVFAARKLKFR